LQIKLEVTQKNLFEPMSDKIDSEENKQDFEKSKRKDQKKQLGRLQKARVRTGCKMDKYVRRITGNRRSRDKTDTRISTNGFDNKEEVK
jgi:hypothetical protein